MALEARPGSLPSCVASAVTGDEVEPASKLAAMRDFVEYPQLPRLSQPRSQAAGSCSTAVEPPQTGASQDGAQSRAADKIRASPETAFLDSKGHDLGRQFEGRAPTTAARHLFPDSPDQRQRRKGTSGARVDGAKPSLQTRGRVWRRGRERKAERRSDLTSHAIAWRKKGTLRVVAPTQRCPPSALHPTLHIHAGAQGAQGLVPERTLGTRSGDDADPRGSM